MTTRNKRSLCLLAAGLVFIATGWALGSGPCSMVGFTFAALVVRYRNNAAPWECLCFVALLTALLVWGLRAIAWPTSPLLGAISLMLSYVFDYIDEQRQKRLAYPSAASVTDTANAEPGAPPDGRPAARIKSPNVPQEQPSAS
jgi:hypothetical protein